MKATDLLKAQHREVKGLFKKVDRSEQSGERRRLLDQIARALTTHTKIEEEVFYPAVREVGSRKAEEMVMEAYEEHHVVDLVVKELPGVDPEDERFHAKMTVLRELVLHHMEEEEKEMFKLAERLGKEQLNALGQQMQAMAGDMGGQRRKAA